MPIHFRKFSAAEPSDLYEGYQQAVNNAKNIELPLLVKEILGTWEHNLGYPVVTAMKNDSTNEIQLLQVS